LWSPKPALRPRPSALDPLNRPENNETEKKEKERMTETTQNPIMSFNDLACGLRDWFSELSHKMGSQGNTLWLVSAAITTKAVRCLDPKAPAFSGQYELTAGSVNAVAARVFQHYNAQFQEPVDCKGCDSWDGNECTDPVLNKPIGPCSEERCGDHRCTGGDCDGCPARKSKDYAAKCTSFDKETGLPSCGGW
jgi:hypothetical protein